MEGCCYLRISGTTQMYTTPIFISFAPQIKKKKNAVIIKARNSNEVEICKWTKVFFFSVGLHGKRNAYSFENNSLISDYGVEYKWSVHLQGNFRVYFNHAPNRRQYTSTE